MKTKFEEVLDNPTDTVEYDISKLLRFQNRSFGYVEKLLKEGKKVTVKIEIWDCD